MSIFTLKVETINAALDAALPCPRWPFPAGLDYLGVLYLSGDTAAINRELIRQYLRRR